MSNFHFLKKDLEWKIVKTQCWGPQPTYPPQPTNGTLSSSVIVQERTLYTLAPWHPARSALIPIAPFDCPSTSLFYTRSREKIPLSWESRNEWQIEIWVPTILAPLHHIHRHFVHPYFLSWVVVQERKLYTHHYTPVPGTQEMSGKLRYEWQIILRYYPHIIHELSLERPTTTAPCKTIPLERQTTPHLLSHWTTHLQYWWKDYVYSLSQ